GAGSAAGPGSAAPPDHAVDQTDRMPVEDTARPAADKTDKPRRPDRSHATDRSDKPHTTERPSKPAPAVDDDPLGKLQGGVKPGDRKSKSR
ncbi:MAG TPA: hypothetical protein VIX73_38735, partial [Kofleriaceae bacterium]